MKSLHDVFVGTIAIGFGSLLLLGAALKGQALMSLAKPQMLSRALGPRGARVVLGAIGLALVAMGVLITRGWRACW
jgi:hypothetical protein